MADKAAKSRRLKTANFIERSTAIFGDRFDYSRVEYVTSTDCVDVYCREHSVWFKQQPTKHVAGSVSCVRCERAAIARKLLWTNDEFVAAAKTVHGDRYDYSKSQYVAARKKILIVCPTHGEWWQQAGSHLSGCGCPECGIWKVFHESHIPEHKRSDPAIVYVLEIDVAGQRLAKLGYTSNMRCRLSSLKKDGVFVASARIFKTTKYDGYKAERQIHLNHRTHRVAPLAWFGGRTECYPVDMADGLLLEAESVLSTPPEVFDCGLSRKCSPTPTGADSVTHG